MGNRNGHIIELGKTRLASLNDAAGLVNITSILILVALCISCTSQEAYHPPELIHKRDVTLQFPDSDPSSGMFKKWVVDEGRNILALNDVVRTNIYLFDLDGNYITSIGKHGRGPSELSSILGFDLDTENEHLVIWDQSQDLIKTFDFKGELLGTAKGVKDFGYFEVSDDIHADGQNMYLPVVSSDDHPNTPWNSPIMLVYEKGRYNSGQLGRYSNLLQEATYYSDAPMVSVNESRDEFYVAYESLPVVEIFDLTSGQRKNTLRVQSTDFKSLPKAEYPDPLDPSKSYDILTRISLPRELVHTENYIVLYFSNTRENESDRFFISFFSIEDPKYVGTVEIPRPLRAATQSGELYFELDNHPDQFTYSIYAIGR